MWHSFSASKMVFAATVVVAFALMLSACDDDGETPSPSAPPGTAVADVTETPEGSEELLYARADGSAWIYNTGTGEQRQIVESGVCERWSTAAWNHDGSLVAMTCGTSATSDVFRTDIRDAAGGLRYRLEGSRALSWSPGGNRLLVLQEMPDDDAGRRDQLAIHLAQARGPRPVAPIEDASTGLFSPDGTLLAYYRPADASCAPGCETGLVIRDIDGGGERGYGDVAPAAWVLGGDAIIVRPYEPNAGTTGASIMAVSSGEMTPFPGDSGFAGYWVTDDGSRVVFLSQAEGLGLGVLDVATLDVTQISGSRISYPSDHIPEQHVALTDDLIYWFDATGEGSPWFSARYDGTGLTQLGEAPSIFLIFSMQRRFVAYPTVDTTGEESYAEVARIDGTQQVELGPLGFVMAWRPRQ